MRNPPQKVELIARAGGMIEVQMGTKAYSISSGPCPSIEAAMLHLASIAFVAWEEASETLMDEREAVKEQEPLESDLQGDDG